MRKFLLKLLLKWYLRDLPTSLYVSSGEEMQLYRFSKDEDVEKIIKVNLTAQMKRHFDAKEGSDEKLITKGSALILKIMLDSHRSARELHELGDKGLKLWEQRRKRVRTN